MDMWKYFGITHEDHTLMNPMSLTKTRELIELLRLDEGERILDVACGKAEFLCLVSKRYDVQGVGIDASPYTIAAARENVKKRGLDDRIELLHMDGATYKPIESESFAVSSCIGGSWIFQTHKGTLEALTAMARPGALVLVGEPYWRNEPDPEYLRAVGYQRDQHGSHQGNVQTGLDLGLTFLYSVVSNRDDWDRYEGLQWQAAERHALSNPDDPDRDELMQKVHRSRDAYLRWGRECLGWGMYLFRKL